MATISAEVRNKLPAISYLENKGPGQSETTVMAEKERMESPAREKVG